MPHKMNTRSAERINGFMVLLRGYAAMVGELAGDQWNEGDVSCSVVRRVALPDAFFALDGLLETTLTVLDDFGAFPAVIERELDRYLPFLATTKVLMAAVRNGRRPRESRTRRSRRTRSPSRWRCGRRAPTATTCSTDWPPTPGSGSAAAELGALLAEPMSFTGAARDQVRRGCGPRRRARRRPGAATIPNRSCRPGRRP